MVVVINIGLIRRPAQAILITRSSLRTRIYSKTVTLICDAQLCVVVWILLIVYKTGLVEQIDDLRPVSNGVSSSESSVQDGAGRSRADESSWMMKDAVASDAASAASNGVVGGTGHENHDELWRSLSQNHWPVLFAHYNISLTGRCVMLLICQLCR